MDPAVYPRPQLYHPQARGEAGDPSPAAPKSAVPPVAGDSEAGPPLFPSREVEEGAEGRRERAAWTPHVSFTARGYELLTAGLGPVAPGS